MIIHIHLKYDDIIKMKNKQLSTEQKEDIIICNCGSYIRRSYLKQHQKTKKHIKNSESSILCPLITINNDMQNTPPNSSA